MISLDRSHWKESRVIQKCFRDNSYRNKLISFSSLKKKEWGEKEIRNSVCVCVCVCVCIDFIDWKCHTKLVIRAVEECVFFFIYF